MNPHSFVCSHTRCLAYLGTLIDRLILPTKIYVYEIRKIQGFALPQKEWAGQVGQCSCLGMHHSKPHDVPA